MSNQDLAQQRGRRTATDRATRGRTTMIPTDDRLRRAPGLDVVASMRTADRGDDVEEIRRTLGMVEGAVSKMIDLDLTKFEETEKENAGEAAKDLAQGTVDEALAQKSRAYSDVIARGRVTEKVITEFPQIEQRIMDGLIASGSADPAKGEHRWDLDDVDQALDAEYKALLVGEDGKAIDFGSPAANLMFYEQVQQGRAGILQKAANTIHEQVKEEGQRANGTLAIADLQKGDMSAIESAIQRGRDLGIPPGESKDMLYKAVISATISAKDETIIQRALASMQADGKTPTWDPMEKAQLLQAYTTYHNQWENERRVENERLSDENIGKALPDMVSGKFRLDHKVMGEMIAKGPKNGGVLASDAAKLWDMQNAVDARKQQEIERQRSDTRWTWAQQEHSNTLRNQALQAQNLRDQREYTALQASYYQGAMTKPQAIARLDRLYKSGGLTDNLYVSGRQFLMQMPSPAQLVSQTGGASYETEFKTEVSKIGEWVRRGQGPWTPQSYRTASQRAEVAFYSTLQSTQDPEQALRSALSNFYVPRQGGSTEKALVRARNASLALDPKAALKHRMAAGE